MHISHRRRGIIAGACLGVLTSGCSNDQPPTGGAAVSTVTNMTTVATMTGSTTAPPPTTAPPRTTPAAAGDDPNRPTVPDGVTIAIPFQSREDVALDQFEIRIVNGSSDRFEVEGVRLLWAGITTPAIEHSGVIVAGQTVDLPLPFPGATCVGDGTIAEMPPLDAARVELNLAAGTTIRLPVVDQFGLAQGLYRDDCQRQSIDELVRLEWTDLHEEMFDHRPVTVGALTMTRRDGVGDYSILSVSNTIPFVFEAVDGAVDGAVVMLPASAETASADVRFLESRCDPHALGEFKQPTKFVAQLRFPDGTVHPYIIYPDRSQWSPMLQTAFDACVVLGKVVPLG